MRILAVLFSLLFSLAGQAQSDSVAYTSEYRFADGIFFTIDDLKANKPSIPFADMYTKTEKKYSSVSDLFESKSKVFYDSAGTEKRIPKKYWAYCSNGVLYKMVKGRTIRIINVGKMMYAVQFYVGDSQFTDANGNTFYSSTPEGAEQYFIDFETGLTYEFTGASVEKRLKKNDPELYEEFMAIGGVNKRNKMAMAYLLKYNKRHPIYFPKN